MFYGIKNKYSCSKMKLKICVDSYYKNTSEMKRYFKEVRINGKIRGYVDRTFADEIYVKLPCGYSQRFWTDGSDESKVLTTEHMKAFGIESI